MAINPNLIEIKKVTEFASKLPFLQAYFSHCGTDGVLYKATMDQLANFLSPYITAIGGSGFLPTTGTVLPAASNGKYTVVGAGTFTQASGGDVTTTGLISILGSTATTWAVINTIPIPSTVALKADLNYKGTYDSIAEALVGFPSGERKLGDTVGVIENGIVVEYWWESVLNNAGLVVKKVKSYTSAIRDSLTANGVYVKTDNFSSVLLVGSTAGTIRQTEITIDANAAIIRTRTYNGSVWTSWFDYIGEITKNTNNSFMAVYTGSVGRDALLTPGIYVNKNTASGGYLVVSDYGTLIRQTEVSSDASRSYFRTRTYTGGVWSAWTDYIADLIALQNTVSGNATKLLAGSFTMANIDTIIARGVYVNNTTGDMLRVGLNTLGRYLYSQELTTTTTTGVIKQLRYWNNVTNTWEKWFYSQSFDTRKAIAGITDWQAFTNYSVLSEGYIGMNTKELVTSGSGQRRTTPIPLSETGNSVLVNISALTTGVVAIAYYNSDTILAANYLGMEQVYGSSGVITDWLLVNIPSGATHFVVSSANATVNGIVVRIPKKSASTGVEFPSLFYSYQTTGFGIFNVYTHMGKGYYARVDIQKFEDAGIRANLWRIAGGSLHKYVGGAMISQSVSLLTGSESECVFSEAGKSDFTMGYHGDEILTIRDFFIDDLPFASYGANVTFREIQTFRYRQVSNVLDTDNPVETIICNHVKETHIENGGYRTWNKLYNAQRDIPTTIMYFGISCITNAVGESYASAMSGFVTPTKLPEPGVLRINEVGTEVIEYFSETNKVSASVKSSITKALKANGTDNTNLYNFNALMIVWDTTNYQKYYRRMLNRTLQPGEVWEGECTVKFKTSKV